MWLAYIDNKDKCEPEPSGFTEHSEPPDANNMKLNQGIDDFVVVKYGA